MYPHDFLSDLFYPYIIVQNIVSHFGTGIPNFVFTLVIDAWSYPRQDQIKKEGHKLKMTQDVKLMINLIFDAFG